jgi:hypothetical protein
MFQAVQTYMSIPESEVDIEKLFNTGQDILNLRRFSINSNILGMMIMLKNALGVKEESKNM